VVKIGDELEVRVIEIDPQGRVNLSAIGLDEPFDPSTVKPREDRGRGGFGGPRGDRGRESRGGFGGPRGGDRGGDRGGYRDRDRDPDRGFRGAPGPAAAVEAKEEDETPKARFRPRR